VKKRGKAQISVFLVIGLMIILFFGLLVVISRTADKEQIGAIDRFAALQSDVFPPDKYIAGCTNLAVRAILPQVHELLPFTKQGDSVILHEKSGSALFTHSSVETILDTYLAQEITNCINISVYEDQGFTVTTGLLKANATVKEKQIYVLIDFPLRLQKAQTVVDKKDFFVTVPIAYGLLIDTTNEVMQNYIDGHAIDINKMIHSKKNTEDGFLYLRANISKPYPHVRIDLALDAGYEDIPFSFTLMGTDAFTSTFWTDAYNYKIHQTSCEFDTLCVTDIDEKVCLQEGGTVVSTCVQQDFEKSTIPLASCEGYTSGDSWCGYDEGVGSRHSRYICVDGQIILEPCRDYRQEVCVQKNNQAQCRINTAYVCSSCTTKDCCESYDCNFKQNVCSPKVPLGIPHWNPGIAAQYCQGETTNTCSLSGDCGSAKNIVGESGSSELFSVARSSYDTESLTFDTPLLGLENTASKKDSITSQIQQALYELEQFSLVSPTEFLDPDTELDYISATAFCPIYIATKNGDCSQCQGKSCGQYTCQSLGRNCKYVQNGDSSICTSFVNATAKLIMRDATSTFGAVRASMGQFTGYRLVADVPTSKAVDITFYTDEPALCKPTYVPGKTFEEIKAPDLSDGTYTTNHSLNIRFVNDLPVFEKLRTSFSAQNYDELLTLITDFSFEIKRQKQRYHFLPRFQSSISSYFDDIVQAYVNDNTQSAMDQMIAHLQSQTFSVFVNCIGANDGRVDSFVTFALEHSCDLPIAPKIQYAAADHISQIRESFVVETDIYSTCKFDEKSVPYEQMKFTMDCASHVYDLSQDGTYICSAKTNVTEFFVSCSEKQVLPRLLNTTLIVTNDGLDVINSSAILNETLYVKNTSLALSAKGAFSCMHDNKTVSCSASECTFLAVNNSQITCEEKIIIDACTQEKPLGVSTPIKLNFEKYVPFILQVTEENSILTVLTSTNTTCTWGSTSSSFGRVPMRNLSGSVNTSIFDLSSYVVTCTDSFGGKQSQIALSR
jgi:hypothetical protein